TPHSTPSTTSASLTILALSLRPRSPTRIRFVSSCMTPRPPRPTLFPYTTLFRSDEQGQPSRREHQPGTTVSPARRVGRCGETVRSEEHTSELQSRENLVCRLLLEKKKLLVYRGLHTNSENPVAAQGPVRYLPLYP